MFEVDDLEAFRESLGIYTDKARYGKSRVNIFKGAKFNNLDGAKFAGSR